jgi:DNA-binding response OmpR family regulator
MSRPKKIILCVDSDSVRLSCLSYLLETHGYRVIAVNGAASAMETLARTLPGVIDLLLSELVIVPRTGAGFDGNELCQRAKELYPELRCLLISSQVKEYPAGIHADMFLPKALFSNLELLERVRVMVARKRGPKKACGRELLPVRYQQPKELTA